MKKELTPEQKEARRIYQKNYYLLTKEKRKKYLKDKSEIISNVKKEWYNKNKEIAKQNVLNYKKNNKEKVRNYNKKYNIKYYKYRILNDVIFRLSIRIRQSLSKSFKKNGYTKNSRTHEILGCSYVEFKLHIESQFESWMNWDNYGLYNGELNHGWDIDHIIPCSSAKTEEDVYQLNHYTNLQPLCSYVNRVIKRNT